LSANAIELVLPGRLLNNVRRDLEHGEHVCADETDPNLVQWTIPAVLQPRGGRANVKPTESDTRNRDPVLINALRRAHKLVERDEAGLPVIKALPQSRYEFRLMRLALLSPRIQRDILAGRQPDHLCLEDIAMAEIPSSWAKQEREFKSSKIACRT
jgi:hypothetical protein